MEALSKQVIKSNARQILDFILRKTYGFNKREDRISLSQFYLGTGIRKQHIVRSIQYLKARNLIFVTQTGYKKYKIYRFNKDFTTWKNITQTGKVTQTGYETLPKQVTPIYTKDTNTKDTIVRKHSFPPSQSHFYKKWESVFKNKYAADFGKDGKIFKDLAKFMEQVEIISLIDKFFSISDDFLEKSGYTVGVFKTQVNKLRAQKTEYKKEGKFDPRYKAAIDKLIKDTTKKIGNEAKKK